MIPWLARAERRWITLGLMLSHRIRAVSEILAPHVEHLWVVRGYLPAQERVAVGADRKKPWLEKFPDFPVS